MFRSSQFTPTPFYSAQGKARFANHLAIFVTAGFPLRLFKPWFYQLLSTCTFGMIAEFGIENFYITHFATVSHQIVFIERCLAWRFYGSPEHTFADVEQALQLWLVKARVEENLRQQAADEQETRDRAAFTRLSAKYGA
jgi:hypothetical protein